ncbi:uncharacterized protein LOC131218989 isoform X2 [Magnolia sinica]|uniref:uncharacterized protein LOC131218989 isoform X2 n=1 Tax=Magnolia sinica TaxID=86752 RepID=UPI00265B35FF|nr:uncharacterized protein LOC131218989 isoform X2 [Magnolia sinica]
MSGVGFWVLAIAVGTALTFLACSGYFPDSVFHDNEERVLTMPTHRKLKERIYKLNGVLKKKRDLSSVNLEDYRPVDPVPSSKASIKPGPTPHGTPLIPYIPQPTPPNHPGPKHGGSP